MKSFLALALAATSFSSMAVEIYSAKLDASQENLIVYVKYIGGCKKHDFSLRVGRCLESMPVRCEAEVVETVKGFDGCESVRLDEIVFNLQANDLTDSYYSGATLNLYSKGSQGKRVTVQLPR
jgi:hypothetical protein